MTSQDGPRAFGGLPDLDRVRSGRPQHGVVKRGTLASILRQAGLTPAEFLKLLG